MNGFLRNDHKIKNTAVYKIDHTGVGWTRTPEKNPDTRLPWLSSLSTVCAFHPTIALGKAIAHGNVDGNPQSPSPDNWHPRRPIAWPIMIPVRTVGHN